MKTIICFPPYAGGNHVKNLLEFTTDNFNTYLDLYTGKDKKVHAQDAGGNSGERIDGFKRAITLEGDLTADQRQKLLEIADKCPVHRTLERANQVTTILAK